VNLAGSWATLRDRLARQGIADASLEAEVLHRHVLGLNRAGFFSTFQSPLEPSVLHAIAALAERRLSGEPLAYIVGHREFYGLDFAVNEHVLVPRQETELLVDLTLKAVADMGLERPHIADAGTGSGAIAIALAKHLQSATVYATDISREALDIAAANCRAHGVADRVRLLHGDLLAPLDGAVDVIVSNPPYIPSAVLNSLAPELKREPRLALDGGADGLDVIRCLLAQAPGRLSPGGLLVMELSPEQREPVAALARQAMPDAGIAFSRDLLDLVRAVTVEPLTREQAVRRAQAMVRHHFPESRSLTDELIAERREDARRG
jgi:release factor glutamine methyltransferase